MLPSLPNELLIGHTREKRGERIQSGVKGCCIDCVHHGTSYHFSKDFKEGLQVLWIVLYFSIYGLKLSNLQGAYYYGLESSSLEGH